ncbi:MAG: hypothetical protein P1Q69_21250, partial [Candidatus Thorarchaeota archaeon]|nr:hypothetical protein [Candidatus Thorarchaeota archaeon]
MDLMIAIILVIGTITATIFNYFLNLAPGSDPEDFQIGPEELGLRCDCYLNTVIIAGIAVIGIASFSGTFENRLEFYAIAVIVFAVVTLAGIIGRRQRYSDWNELSQVIRRAVPTAVDRPT